MHLFEVRDLNFDTVWNTTYIVDDQKMF
jgi:hypothetical protein